MEVWRDIRNYKDHYEVSSYGNVRSLKQNGKKLLSTSLNSNSELTVALCLNGHRKTHCVKRLVATEFFNFTGDSAKLCVNHIDGDKTNNSVENLNLWFKNDFETPICNIKGR